MALLGTHTLVDARAGRRLDNALKLTYRSDGPGVLAEARQGSAGMGGKLGTLLGFKNGGSGRHVISDGEGTEQLVVECIKNEPTTVSDAQGQVRGTIARGDRGTLADPSGTVLAVLIDDPEPAASDSFGLLVNGPDGGRLGTFTVIRSAAYYSIANDLLDQVMGFEPEMGRPLQIPIVGCILALDAPVGDTLGELLLATITDVCIGLRGLTPGMR